MGKANGFFAGESHQWVIEFPFPGTSSKDQLSLPGQLALHFLEHLLVLNPGPAHFVGMFGQDFANFFVQAVFDADLFLHRNTHPLRKGRRLRGLNHFGSEQALHHFASHVSNVIAREKHRVIPLMNSEKQFTVPREEVSRKVRTIRRNRQPDPGRLEPIICKSFIPNGLPALPSMNSVYPRCGSWIILDAGMLTRIIPSSNGETLPVIGIGTYKGFDVGSGSKERAALGNVLRTMFSLEGRVLDSSPMYGRAEEVAGELLAAHHTHEKAFVATKVWTQGRSAGIEQMKRSMKLLRCENIDLMQIHNLVDWRTHLETLRAWKEEGRIRYLGITHYSSSAYGEMEKIMRAEALDFVQLNYSLDDREAERRLLPLAEIRGVAVLINLPFGAGSLFRTLRGKRVPPWMQEAGCETWSQVLLRFTLAHKAVTCVIPGTGNPDHMAENCRAGDGPMLQESIVRKLVDFWDSQ
jgi:diketogulonate reductase-like aldo/keto reductase